MSEQEEDKKPEETPKPEDTKDGNDTKELSVIERANLAAERSEKAVEALQKENDRLERLQAEDKLAGTGGTPVETKPKEETPKEYMEKVMSGELNND